MTSVEHRDEDVNYCLLARHSSSAHRWPTSSHSISTLVGTGVHIKQWWVEQHSHEGEPTALTRFASEEILAQKKSRYF